MILVARSPRRCTCTSRAYMNANVRLALIFRFLLSVVSSLTFSNILAQYIFVLRGSNTDVGICYSTYLSYFNSTTSTTTVIAITMAACTFIIRNSRLRVLLLVPPVPPNDPLFPKFLSFWSELRLLFLEFSAKF